MRDAGRQGVAVGFFDGVHAGHRAVLRDAARAVTFSNHPLSVLAPEKAPRLVMAPDDKLAAIAECGVEATALDFTPALAAMEPEDFAMRFLADAAGRPGRVVCGGNWRFGAGGRGDAALLRSLGFETETPPFAMRGGERISSSRIRQCLERGDIAEANAMLSRPFSLAGLPFKGKGVGGKIGFPTINLRSDAWRSMVRLPRGVYAVSAAGARAVANLGVAPTLENAAWPEAVLELHFADAAAAERAAENETLRASFLRFIRPEKKFATMEELAAQIGRDCEDAFRER